VTLSKYLVRGSQHEKSVTPAQGSRFTKITTPQAGD